MESEGLVMMISGLTAHQPMGVICVKMLDQILWICRLIWIFAVCIWNGPPQAKKCLRACSKYAESYHPAHAQIIIRAFALHLYILLYPMILLVDSEGPANAQADLGLHCLRMSVGTFSHGASQIMSLFPWSSSNNSWKSYLNRHIQQLKKQALQQ